MTEDGTKTMTVSYRSKPQVGASPHLLSGEVIDHAVIASTATMGRQP